MMKSSFAIAMFAAVIMMGCTSVVTTYDSNGQKIGSCVAERGAFASGAADCTGTANQEGRTR